MLFNKYAQNCCTLFEIIVKDNYRVAFILAFGVHLFLRDAESTMAIIATDFLQLDQKDQSNREFNLVQSPETWG